MSAQPARVVLWAIALVWSAVLMAHPASAQPAGYQTIYSKGVNFEKIGQIVDALLVFESIPVEKRDFNTRLHIAGCKQKLNRLLAARADYEAIRADPNADPATVDTAAAALSDLDPRIPLIRLRLATKDVLVRLDGKEVTADAVRVDPGPHTVVAKRGDTIVFERKLDLDEGTTVVVNIEAPTIQPSVVPPSVAPAAAAPRKEASAGLTGVPFYVVGAVAMIAAAGGLVIARSAYRDVEAACREQLSFDCNEDAAGAGRVKTWQSVSFISAGVAVIAVGVGIAIDVARPAKRSASLRLEIGAASAGTGIALVGTF